MPDYVNPNPFVVHLVGPDGVIIRVKPHSKIQLSEYYTRYVSRGFIKLAKAEDTSDSQSVNDRETRITAELRRTNNRRINIAKPAKDKLEEQIIGPDRHVGMLGNAPHLKKRRIKRTKKKLVKRKNSSKAKDLSKLVGRTIGVDANELMGTHLRSQTIPISNNIGIGILSYQRLASLKRLIDSVRKYTNLYKTTVFISDDASTDIELSAYLEELADSDEFVVIKNSQRLGIAGNSNRLLRCLSRFKYGILINDDMEIQNEGWEHFYVRALEQTGMHHLIFRQPGIYGARKGQPINNKGIILTRVDDKPHGAMLVFTHEMLSKCGFFNESYGIYGMEHVDWSSKVWEFGLQQNGFYDVEGSEQFVMLHGDKSAVDNREQLFKQAKEIWKSRQEQQRILPTASSIVPEISYVVPFRDFERSKSIKTVIDNIRAQRFPVVNIVMTEQDVQSRISIKDFQPVRYAAAIRTDKKLFNKSYAFNQGVMVVPSDKVILHDADMITFGDYARKIWHILENSESCHIGGRVLYTDKLSCSDINSNGSVATNTTCERVVGYYEGGSLACTVKAYWKCGAFNEDFWGYGCEDCDFYKRLSEYTKWYEDRSYDLVHLWHSRVEGWNEHHDINKKIEAELRKLSVAERVERQLIQLIKNGYKKKLQDVGVL